MTGRRVLGIGRRRVVVGVSAVCVLLCLLCLLRVVDGFDGAWEDAFGPSERANERPLVDDEKGTSERLSSSSSSPSPRSRSSRSRSPRSSPRPSVAVVVTSPWASERAANARRICALAGTFARDGCALAISTEIDEKAATRIEEAGYVRRFQRSAREEAALGGKFGFRSAARATRRPREYYARKVSEKKKTRLYEEGDERSRRPGSVGNLVGVFGVLARFATEETLPTVNATEDGIGTLAGDMWPNVKDAIARAKAFNRAHPERMGDSIALFEDDANVVVASAEAYAEKVSSVMRRLPRRWDLLSFDAHPNFCRESFFKHPSRAVSRRHGLFQTYTTFSRTTHIFVSRRGALRILEELPSDIVIDMFLARALRLGKLKIYIACDNGIVDQATSEFQSLGG